MDGMSMSGMTMSMSGSPSSTISGMSMASSTASSSSDGMAMGTMMGMDSMSMTFFTSTSTPLFSSSWTPNSIGQYAGTCIFLIAFATIFRALLAVRINFFEVLALVKSRHSKEMRYALNFDDKSRIRPWRANEAITLGFMDVVLAGIGYLLMVAVMTMNVGYFMSILAGVFLGSVAFGRFMAHSGSH